MMHAKKDDSIFLQNYMNGLGASRVAMAFQYIASAANVMTLSNANGESDSTRSEQFQDMADVLSTLVTDKQFSQNDMDQFVAQFAKCGDLSSGYFAKDVLGKASPEVNQMFYQSAKDYVLKNADSAVVQSMAADAMQALSQTSPSYSMQQLADLDMPHTVDPDNEPDNLKTLIAAAMKGEAAHGALGLATGSEEYLSAAVTGNIDGDQMTGLSHLIFNAAYSGRYNAYCPPQLSTEQAADLQASLFADAMDTMVNSPSVASFYTSLCLVLISGASQRRPTQHQNRRPGEGSMTRLVLRRLETCNTGRREHSAGN